MMKRLFSLVIAMVCLLVFALPAQADVGTHCAVYKHSNDTQKFNWCIGINHTHSANSVHFSFNDGEGQDIYYLRNVWLYLVNGQGTLIEARSFGDIPVFANDTDLWLDHGCFYGGNPYIIGSVAFKIEWNPGQVSPYHSEASDAKVGLQCL